MGINAIILEHEAIAGRMLGNVLQDICRNGLEVQHTFQSVVDLGEHLTELAQRGILLLGIQMTDGSGSDISNLNQGQPRVIFVSGHEQFTAQASRKKLAASSLNLLNKEDTIARAKVNSQEAIDQDTQDISPYKKRFLIRFGGKLYSVPTHEISYVYSEEKLSFFILKDGTRVPSDFRLQEIQDVLDPEQFFRINRQFVVHIGAIDKMIRYSRSRINIKLNPPYSQDIIISTKTTPRFKEWMDR